MQLTEFLTELKRRRKAGEALIFTGADLSWANLSWANLAGANLEVD